MKLYVWAQLDRVDRAGRVNVHLFGQMRAHFVGALVDAREHQRVVHVVEQHRIRNACRNGRVQVGAVALADAQDRLCRRHRRKERGACNKGRRDEM